MDKLSHPLSHSPFWLRHLPRIGLLVGVLLVLGGTGWWFSQPGKNRESSAIPVSANATVPLRVKTAIARLQSVETKRVLTGTVEPVETVNLTSRVTGKVRQLAVQEGDRVKTGDTLVVIDVADIQAQSGQALAGVNMAQSNYQTAQAQWREARAQLQEAEAELADARLEQQRMAMLRSEGAVSQQVLDKANTRVQMTQARIQQIQAGISQAQATMNQARAQVKQSQAQVSQVSANLNYGKITAPFNGTITRKHAEVGAMAGPGQQLVTLESSDRLRFSTQVPESLIVQVTQGQPVSVRLDALNRSVLGAVSQIIPSADPKTRNFEVKVALNKVSGMIPGMFGRLQLADGAAATFGERIALVIPKSAIIKQFGVTGVFKIDDKDRAIFQPITTGKTQNFEIEVFSGLKAGNRLVLEPTDNLKEGIALQID
ncbi:efflux RND transporter periplasmic adaptor subunit [Nostoc favosum]|uniref:Efflux RND transporter periplasmic adaptor subunit n=1 Tax=Nostoc favosum CHAB5714 TaxID=2780399 RepID=A0ABS8IDE1_9NOSO|nr:efflux RND transporter periplasmic adaptor subunit [Nostoc favosum]MCC5601901.1 efflux RND transporter periplasmic adaptor subunit [Nostoc favosum CHAB5714]